MKNVNVIITAGGTHEKIDEVRKITNMSTGALGVKIAEEITKNYTDIIGTIYYLCSKHAIQPKHEKIRVIHTESVADVSAALDDLLVNQTIHYVIHSMAISDYTTKNVTNTTMLAREIVERTKEMGTIDEEAIHRIIQGNTQIYDNKTKISSKEEDMIVTLKQTEKIISKIKQLAPKTFLVGFKLLNGVEEEELFDVAFNLLRKNRCNLVLANDLQLIKEGTHTGLLVYPEKKYDKLVGKESIAKGLVDTMFKRGESRHPNSLLVEEENDVPETAVATFRTIGETLYNRQLLPLVEGGTYGNMSVKTTDGFIITGRNVQKGWLDKDMLVRIERVEELTPTQHSDVFAKVYYKGKVKPSIDTAIHHFIYEKTNHKAILHVHTDKIFAGLPLTNYNYACGTEDEMKSIVSLLTDDSVDVVQMYKHGLIVLGNNLAECYEKLTHVLEKTMHIEPVNCTKDEQELNEWKAHYAEVKVNSNEAYDLENDEKYWIVKTGDEKLATLFMDEKKEELAFVLYGLEEKRMKGSNVAGNVITILSAIAKNKEKNTLTLVTVDDCHVADFYEAKHGFTKKETFTETKILTKAIV